MILSFKKKTTRVTDYAEASKIYSDARHKSGQGARSWRDGTITDDNGVPIARISYNGKVWPVDPWYPEMLPLYSPYA